MSHPPEDVLGAHVSIAGGVHLAPSRAAEIGTRWTQIFTKQPQRWAEPVFGSAEGDAYCAACDEYGIAGTTVHASYLINAASPDAELYEMSLRSLAAEYRRCVTIGARHLVVHPGSATDGERGAGLRRNAQAVIRTLRGLDGATVLCLENTTGRGNVLGSDLAELADLFGLVLDEAPDLAGRTAVCLDTCHLYASGYDLRHDYDGVMNAIDRSIGHEHVRVWHLNDSRGTLGSRVDRHAWIGEGEMGVEGFRRLLLDERHAGTPMLLETPKGADPVASDRLNLELLRRLRE